MVNHISENIHFEQQVPVSSSDTNVLEHLANNTTLSKQKIKQAMSNGSVWLESTIGTHRIRRAKKILSPGEKLHIYYDDAIQKVKTAEAILIADESEYSIWNKPYGMYSQGSKWGDHCTIYRWAETHLQPDRPAFLVHRLDRAARGLIILAHTKKMATAFSDMFRHGKIIKQYKAEVEGVTEAIELPHTISLPIDNKAAISRIITIDHSQNTSILTIEIETGRKHQIRKHLSEINLPIIGDRLYGTGLSNKNLQLQSVYLEFSCPLTDRLKEYRLS